jgi:hypothetical protein
MEFDVFYSDLMLAFEFQGRQHYRDCFQGGYERQQQRDNEKRGACQAHNITLIIVPFWWDCSEMSLAATIHKYRPDVPLVLDPAMLAQAKQRAFLQEQEEEIDVEGWNNAQRLQTSWS